MTENQRTETSPPPSIPPDGGKGSGGGGLGETPRSFPGKNRKTVLIALLIILAFALGLGWRWVQGTPRYALYQIGAALKNRDVARLLMHVDLDSILKQQVAESVSNLLKSTASDHPLGKWLGAIGEFKITLAPGAQSGLSALVRRELEAYLTDPGHPTLPSSFLLLSLAEFHTRGDVSLITLKYEQDQLRLALKKTDGLWRVVELNPEDTQRLIKTYLLK
ncbi:MAG: DUF2939 domain-containing protein [Deltaproteobacteria bacterium]|nr:DUF2939 domain-containing protein [Deltaproteobacteria bacterium]